MLKFLENRDEVVDLVHSLSEQPELHSFKVGVAGSYVTGLNKKASAIDIILKLREGENKDLIGSFEIVSFIVHIKLFIRLWDPVQPRDQEAV